MDSQKEEEVMPPCVDMKNVHQINMFKAIYVSVSFMLLYIAFAITQNMISQIYQQLGYENLGNYALFALYVAQVINNIFAPSIVKKFSFRAVLLMSGLGYIPFLVVGILPCSCFEQKLTQGVVNDNDEGFCSKTSIYSFIIISAIINGYSCSLVWVCQGTYFGILSSSYPEKTGVYFGTFCSFAASSFFIGSTVGTFLLGYTSQTMFFLIMTLIGGIASFMFLFTPSPYQPFQSPNSATEEKEESPNEESLLHRFSCIFKNEQILPLITLMGLSGAILAFYAGYMYLLIQRTLEVDITSADSRRDVNQKTCFVYMCQGVFQVSSGYLSALLAQRFNHYKLLTLATISVQVAFIFALLATYTKIYTLVFFTSAFIGIGDNMLNTVISEVMTNVFQGKSEIYALKSLMMSLVFSILLLINIFLKDSQPFYFLLVLFSYQIASNIASSLLGPQQTLNSASDQIKKSPSASKIDQYTSPNRDIVDALM